MPTTINRRSQQKNDALAWKAVAIFVVPAATILVLLALDHPVSKWISDAAQAEFVGFGGAFSEPTRAAELPPAVHASKVESKRTIQ